MRNLEHDLSTLLQHSVRNPSVSFEELWSECHQTSEVKRAKSRHRWIGVAIPAIIILGGMTAAASSILSNYSGNLNAASKAQGVFEYVNGTPVTNEEFQIYKVGQQLIAQLNHQTMPSEADIVHKFDLEQVAYQEAQKEQLVVTDKQALDYSVTTQQTMEHPPAIADKKNFAQMQQILKAEEKGLGVTDKQYWTEFAPKYYKVGMSIGNLRYHFAQQYQQSHPGAQWSEVIRAWNKYEDHLLSEATIKQADK